MLKHMPPGPPSGQQQRPPTRGLHIRPPQPLNVSALSTPVQQTTTQTATAKPIANGGLRHTNLLLNTTSPATPTNISNNTLNNTSSNNNNNYSNCINFNSTALNTKHGISAREALTSLGLLCLVSLLLALLSLIFLLKISPGGRELPPPPPPSSASAEDYIIVYDVTLALCALSLSLNLCCLLVCAIQFLFAVKLVKAPATTGRGNKYLQKSSVSRVCAVGGFFISIPIFLTGIILYTFTQFHSTPAIITSVLIGIGIVFCGGAMVHNVFVWQKEKTICVRNQPLNLTMQSQISAIAPPAQFLNHSNSNHFNCFGGGNHLTPNPTHQHTQHTHLHTNHATPVISLTPLSPNHSHVSFNHSYVPGYAMRAATATPPTPKIPPTIVGRDASGSISPTNPANNTINLDMSNATNISPHELSTLV